MNFSAQHLIDCGPGEGCSGGSASSSLQYLSAVGAIAEEDDPYVGGNQPCKDAGINSRLRDFHINYVKGSDALIEILAKHGPVVVDMRVTKSLWKVQISFDFS